MINVKTGQFIIEIPKSGSRSLVEAATQAYGKKAFKAHGHHTFLELVEKAPEVIAAKALPKEPYEVVAVIRDPQNRLVSALNEYMRIKQASLDDAYAACLSRSHVIFKDQLFFVEGVSNHNAYLYPLEGILEAQSKVAGRHMSFPLWRNSGAERRRATIEQIKNHPMHRSAIVSYYKDETLYAMAQDWDNVREYERETQLP